MPSHPASWWGPDAVLGSGTLDPALPAGEIPDPEAQRSCAPESHRCGPALAARIDAGENRLRGVASPAPQASEELAIPVDHATPSDRADVVRILAQAFLGQGLTGWVVRSDAKRLARTHAWFSILFDLACPHESVFMDRERTSAALWFPPDTFRVGTLTRLRLLPRFARITGLRHLPSRLAGLSMLVNDHPEEPHYYLEAIGTLPAARRRGAASALLDQGLSLCDRDRVAAFLHTSNPEAIDFYRRRGFEAREPFSLSDELVVQPMWRAPRTHP